MSQSLSTYEPIKKGQTVVSIQFVVESLPNLEDNDSKPLGE